MTPTETIAEMIRHAPHACALAAAIGECREDRRAYNAAVARVGALDSPHATSEERVERFATQAMAHAYAVDRGVSGATGGPRVLLCLSPRSARDGDQFLLLDPLPHEPSRHAERLGDLSHLPARQV